MRSTRYLSISLLALALAAPAVAGAEAPPVAADAARFTKEAVARVVADRSGEIQDCYEELLAARGANRKQARGGRVVMSWLITPGGTVRDVAVKRTTLSEKGLTTCMADAIQAWEFPRPARPQPVVFPFDLKPSNGLEKDRRADGTGGSRG